MAALDAKDAVNATDCLLALPSSNRTLNQLAVARWLEEAKEAKEAKKKKEPGLPEAPPPALDHLMVVALCSSESERMTIMQIHKWLQTKFQHYRDTHNRNCRKPANDPLPIDYVKPCMCEMSIGTQLRLGFTIPRLVDGLLSPFRFHREDRSISLIPGTVERALFPEQTVTRTFPQYSKLPIELKHEILRHVLLYDIDKPGWSVKGHFMDCRYRLSATINGRQVGDIKLSSIVAPFYVNKEMRSHALQVFYTHSTFHFDNCQVMEWSLRRLGPVSRARLKRVSMDYMLRGNAEKDRRCANDAFRLLSEASNLRYLRLNMDEDNIIRYRSVQVAQSFPGFHILKRLRGLREVEFDGTSKHAEEYLAATLRLPFAYRSGELIKSRKEIEEEKERARERQRQKQAEQQEQLMRAMGSKWQQRLNEKSMAEFWARISDASCRCSPASSESKAGSEEDLSDTEMTG